MVIVFETSGCDLVAVFEDEKIEDDKCNLVDMLKARVFEVDMYVNFDLKEMSGGGRVYVYAIGIFIFWFGLV